MHKLAVRALFYIVFLVFCFQIISVIVVLNETNFVQADSRLFSEEDIPLKYNLQIEFLKFQGDSREITIQNDTIGKYILAVFKYSVSIVGIIATVMIEIGGIIWLTSAGNVTRISTAKSYITSAVVGLILMLVSVTVLWLINPEYINMKALDVEKIQKIEGRCCKSKAPDDEGTTYYWQVYNIVKGCDPDYAVEVTDLSEKAEKCNNSQYLDNNCDEVESFSFAPYGDSQVRAKGQAECNEACCDIYTANPASKCSESRILSKTVRNNLPDSYVVCCECDK